MDFEFDFFTPTNAASNEHALSSLHPGENPANSTGDSTNAPLFFFTNNTSDDNNTAAVSTTADNNKHSLMMAAEKGNLAEEENSSNNMGDLSFSFFDFDGGMNEQALSETVATEEGSAVAASLSDLNFNSAFEPMESVYQPIEESGNNNGLHHHQPQVGVSAETAVVPLDFPLHSATTATAEETHNCRSFAESSQRQQAQEVPSASTGGSGLLKKNGGARVAMAPPSPLPPRGVQPEPTARMPEPHHNTAALPPSSRARSSSQSATTSITPQRLRSQQPAHSAAAPPQTAPPPPPPRVTSEAMKKIGMLRNDVRDVLKETEWAASYTPISLRLPPMDAALQAQVSQRQVTLDGKREDALVAAAELLHDACEAVEVLAPNGSLMQSLDLKSEPLPQMLANQVIPMLKQAIERAK